MTSMIPASDNSSPSPLAVGAGVWALVTGNGNPDEALVSYELKDGASQEAAKGAALAALVLSTMAGHDVQSTATMTFVAVYLSVTRGLAGDLTRAVGEWSSNMVAHVRETTDLSPAAVWTATSNAWTDSRQWFRARQAAHDAAVRRMRDVRKSRQTEAQWDRYVQDVRQEFFVATPEQMEQLRLKEEEKERIRKAAEAERLRIAAEQERLRLEAEAEAERVRLEAEAERERIAKAERNERLRIAGEAKKEQIRLREEAKAERRRVKAERERIRMAAKQEKTRLAAERAKLKSKFEIEQRRVLEIQRKEEDNDLILAQAEHKKKIMAEANQQIRQETDYESQRLEAEKAQILRAGAPFSNEQRRLREIQELQAEKAHIMAMAEEKSLRLELENERIRMAAKEKQRRLADEKERLLQLKTLSTLGNIMESMEYQENVLESRMGEGIGEDSDGLGSTTFRKQKRIQSHAEATSRSLLEARLRFERTRKKYGTARAVSGVGRTRFRTEEGSPVLSRKRDQTRKGPHDKTTDTD